MTVTVSAGGQDASVPVDSPGLWPLMPDERLIWVGRPVAWGREARRELAGWLRGLGQFAAGGLVVALVLAVLWWRFWMWADSGDVLPLPVVLRNVATFVGGLALLALLILVAGWNSSELELSRTRYAVTDRRVIVAVLARRHRFQCLARPVCRIVAASKDGRITLRAQAGRSAKGQPILGEPVEIHRLVGGARFDTLFPEFRVQS